MPWHKFIHPNYIDRTMNIFNQTHPNTTIQFSQVYKTKVGVLEVEGCIAQFCSGWSCL